jgi:uncharacterized protein YqgC (DUF456 family)
MNKILKRFFGIILIILGIIGLALPFLQGFAMIFAGVTLLENKFLLKKVRKLIAWIKSKT